MKFAPDGRLISSFGKAYGGSSRLKMRPFDWIIDSDPSVAAPPPNMFHVPHSLTLVEDWNLVCVADRENERIQVLNLSVCLSVLSVSISSKYQVSLQCFTAGLPTSGGFKRSLPIGMPLKSATDLGRVYAIRAIGLSHQSINRLICLQDTRCTAWRTWRAPTSSRSCSRSTSATARRPPSPRFVFCHSLAMLQCQLLVISCHVAMAKRVFLPYGSGKMVIPATGRWKNWQFAGSRRPARDRYRPIGLHLHRRARHQTRAQNRLRIPILNSPYLFIMPSE